MNNRKISIFVVVRKELLQEGLPALLGQEADVQIVGIAEDAIDAITRIPHLRVDVVLLDIMIADESGTNIFHDYSQTHPDLKVIALINHQGKDYVRAALTLGVAGYVLKSDSHAELMSAIHNVMQGKTYLSPAFTQCVVLSYLIPRIGDRERRNIPDRRKSHRDRRDSCKASKIAEALTYRERQIVKLIAEGHKNKEIAKTLSISPKTVEKHRANLMRKLDRHSISQLTVFAMENGILAVDVAAQIPV